MNIKNSEKKINLNKKNYNNKQKNKIFQNKNKNEIEEDNEIIIELEINIFNEINGNKFIYYVITINY